MVDRTIVRHHKRTGEPQRENEERFRAQIEQILRQIDSSIAKLESVTSGLDARLQKLEKKP
jgi:hypothetical protein